MRPPEPFDAARLADSGVIVDALLGTGFEGSPREPVASAIAAINAAEAPVVACDVPSGVNANSGEVEGEAVRAAVTGTFHGPKLGLYVLPGKDHAGAVETVDIGIPRGAPGAERAGLITDRVIDLFPRRERSGSKFTSGVVVVAGGSRGPHRRAVDGRAGRPRGRGRATCRWRCPPPRSRRSTCACSSR